MNRPTPEQLRDFFSAEIFLNAPVNPDQAIEEFYRRFDPHPDQAKYTTVGIHMDRIIREPYVIAGEDHHEHKTTVHFHFLKNPDQALTFTLWGMLEEEQFFSFNGEELRSFFELRFRRFSKFLNP